MPLGNMQAEIFLHELTCVTAGARPPGGTLTLVGGHTVPSVQARQDADGC